MATVHLAVVEGAAGFSREVAMKLLHPHLAEEPGLVERFLVEARIAAQLRHPNIVPVIDVAEDPRGVYLVMDFVEGNSLAGLLKTAQQRAERLPTPVWVRILCDALAGLHAAHELKDVDGKSLGLVHRDFSPHNILISLDGVARLTDFGIAKLMAGADLTRSGVVKGKINYMSPEQVRDDLLDRRSDIWAAGVVGWELATGRRLRRRSNDVRTLLQISTIAPPRATTKAPDLPHAIDDILARALSLEPSDRFATAAELRSQLLAAGRKTCGVADPEECGEWVQRLSMDRIRERRSENQCGPQVARPARVVDRRRRQRLLNTGRNARFGAAA